MDDWIGQLSRDEVRRLQEANTWLQEMERQVNEAIFTDRVLTEQEREEVARFIESSCKS